MSTEHQDSLEWNAQTAYKCYYESGAYDSRYPCCNSRVLNTISQYTRYATRILDFGCGSGRYTVPLLMNTTASVVAYDVCAAALQQLRARLRSEPCGDRVICCNEPFEALHTLGTYDVILAMFGVISHIARRSERIRLLEGLRTLLTRSPESRLIISVPNSYRRFWWQQMRHTYLRRTGRPLPPAFEPGDIFYSRTMAEECISMFYHLYSVSGIREELETAGYDILGVLPESLLPENWVTGSRILNRLDAVVSRRLPPQLAYGIVIVAGAY